MQEPTLSETPGDEHGGRAPGRLLSFFAGPFAAATVYFLPFPSLSPNAHMLAAIMAAVVIYWIAEPIPLPITALLGTAFCVLAGLGSAKSVFASYAHPIIFLFMGSFLLAEAMAVHGLDRRFAAWILSFAWVGVHPRRILLAIGIVTAFISMWVSNTATTALMLPIALGLLATIHGTPAHELGEFRIGLMLMLSYGATAGGMATIVGTPPNLIGAALIAQQAGVSISFVTWMAVGLPLATLLLLVAWTVLWWLHPAETSMLPGLAQRLQEQKLALMPWTRAQVNASVAFGTAVVLWIVPGLFAAVWGLDNPLSLWLKAHLPNELVAILAAGLLFFLPTNLSKGEWTVSWKQAAGINWGIIILFGGGLAFGELMVETGLSHSIGQGVMALFGSQTVWSLTAGSIVVAVLVSELVSNTATASMVTPVVIAIAQSAGVSPVAPALGACLGASLGFALPVSTPPNAIVYSSGFVPIKSMLRTGLLFDLLGAVLIWLTLRLLCPIVGLV